QVKPVRRSSCWICRLCSIWESIKINVVNLTCVSLAVSGVEISLVLKFRRIWIFARTTLVDWNVIIGEFANFVAYMYAPAVLVTPLGALSIIVSAVLAHFLLKENLGKLGILGCILCVVGSTVIVLHAPGEHSISSVEEIWELAVQPAFLLYMASIAAVVLVLVLHCEPRYGQTNIMVYIGICSVIGSLTVMSIKAIGIAIKLTLGGYSQVAHFKSWVFAMVAVTCIATQLVYLNKILLHFLKSRGSSMQMVRYGSKRTTMNCIRNMWHLYIQIILSEGNILGNELGIAIGGQKYPVSGPC
ncbi:hypothetical protein STAS_15215, partial [Striga asiatica]